MSVGGTSPGIFPVGDLVIVAPPPDIAQLDRSQSAFYFVPQDSHSQAGSTKLSRYFRLIMESLNFIYCSIKIVLQYCVPVDIHKIHCKEKSFNLFFPGTL